MKLTIIILITCTGCTTMSLERHTINQAMTVTDMRYQQVIDDLAAMANNAGYIPTFAIVAGGVTNVANTVGLDSTTLWEHAVLGFSKQTLGLLGTHNPDQQWTLDPVVSEPQLRAMRYACLWVLFGPPPTGSVYDDLLIAPTRNNLSSYHFDVADDLAKLPPKWFCIGRKCDVCPEARYKSHCGDTWVWVTPEGMPGLSEFTLIILDIATVAPTSLASPTPIASVTVTRHDKAGRNVEMTEIWDAKEEGNEIVLSPKKVPVKERAISIGNFVPSAGLPTPQLTYGQKLMLEPSAPSARGR